MVTKHSIKVIIAFSVMIGLGLLALTIIDSYR